MGGPNNLYARWKSGRKGPAHFENRCGTDRGKTNRVGTDRCTVKDMPERTAFRSWHATLPSNGFNLRHPSIHLLPSPCRHHPRRPTLTLKLPSPPTNIQSSLYTRLDASLLINLFDLKLTRLDSHSSSEAGNEHLPPPHSPPAELSISLTTRIHHVATKRTTKLPWTARDPNLLTNPLVLTPRNQPDTPFPAFHPAAPQLPCPFLASPSHTSSHKNTPTDPPTAPSIPRNRQLRRRPHRRPHRETDPQPPLRGLGRPPKHHHHSARRTPTACHRGARRTALPSAARAGRVRRMSRVPVPHESGGRGDGGGRRGGHGV